MFAWVGLPDIKDPSASNQWSGLLTIPRELKLVDDMITQVPLKELEALRINSHTIRGYSKLISTCFELEFSIDDSFKIELTNQKGDRLVFEMNDCEFRLDRSMNSLIYAEDYGIERFVHRIFKQQNIRIFIDNSVAEIFVNNGRHTMTSRFYIENMDGIKLSENITANMHLLGKINGLHV